MRKNRVANRSRKNSAVPSSADATTAADGLRQITSSAWVGPDSTAMRPAFPSSAAKVSMGSRPVFSSTPFEQMTMGVAGAMSSRRSAATERRAAEGVTMTTASAPSQAHA